MSQWQRAGHEMISKQFGIVRGRLQFVSERAGGFATRKWFFTLDASKQVQHYHPCIVANVTLGHFTSVPS